MYASRQNRVSCHLRDSVLTRIHAKKKKQKSDLPSNFCPYWRLMRGDSERHSRISIDGSRTKFPRREHLRSCVLKGLTGCRQRKWEGDARLRTDLVSPVENFDNFRFLYCRNNLTRAHKFRMVCEYFRDRPFGRL